MNSTLGWFDPDMRIIVPISAFSVYTCTSSFVVLWSLAFTRVSNFLFFGSGTFGRSVETSDRWKPLSADDRLVCQGVLNNSTLILVIGAACRPCTDDESSDSYTPLEGRAHYVRGHTGHSILECLDAS